MNPRRQTPAYEIAKTTGEAYAKLDPTEALPVGDPRYVPLDKVRGHVNVAESLRLRVRSQDAVIPRDSEGLNRNDLKFARLLITGHQGCGKTTELFRLRELLEQDGFTVVYFDVEEEFDLLRRDISWWNVILEMIWQIDDQAPASRDDISIPDGPKDEAAEWIARTVTKKQTRREIEAHLETELGAGADIPFIAKVKATLRSLVKTGSTYMKEVEVEADRRPEVLLDALAEIVRSVNKQLYDSGTPGLVVIVDSLEKTPLREHAPGINSHSAMFIHTG